jgi:hypothetical protein
MHREYAASKENSMADEKPIDSERRSLSPESSPSKFGISPSDDPVIPKPADTEMRTHEKAKSSPIKKIELNSDLPTVTKDDSEFAKGYENGKYGRASSSEELKYKAGYAVGFADRKSVLMGKKGKE